MDAALAELAVTAGNTLVRAIAEQGWTSAKKAVLALWHRHAPAQAEPIGADLDTARAELAAVAEVEAADVMKDLADEWAARFSALLRRHPEAAEDVRRVVDQELAPLITQTSTQNARDINQTTHAETGGIAIAAGNNVTIGKLDQPGR
jgi:hypothetical protein